MYGIKYLHLRRTYLDTSAVADPPAGIPASLDLLKQTYSPVPIAGLCRWQKMFILLRDDFMSIADPTNNCH